METKMDNKSNLLDLEEQKLCQRLHKAFEGSGLDYKAVRKQMPEFIIFALDSESQENKCDHRCLRSMTADLEHNVGIAVLARGYLHGSGPPSMWVEVYAWRDGRHKTEVYSVLNPEHNYEVHPNNLYFKQPCNDIVEAQITKVTDENIEVKLRDTSQNWHDHTFNIGKEQKPIKKSVYERLVSYLRWQK